MSARPYRDVDDGVPQMGVAQRREEAVHAAHVEAVVAVGARARRDPRQEGP